MQKIFTKPFILIVIFWTVLVAISGYVRPLYYSSEEMHYASIAWEMWQHNHFILPIQGGLPYAEKGPLLFWLIHLGWNLFGVSTWWMRIMPALFGLGTLLLLPKFILRLWPASSMNSDEKLIANLSPFILLGSFFFAAKIPMMRFDVITTFLVLLSVYSLVLTIEQNKGYAFLLAVSLALGLLTKGPVLFLFVLPPAITAKWWANKLDHSWRSVYLTIMAGLLGGIALTCCWLIPALQQGGSEYASALLFHRSIGRIWYGHHYLQQNWFYYIFILMMMLLPWIIWPPFWQSLHRFYIQAKRQGINSGLRLLLIIIGSAFIFLTFVAEKGPRYILPVLPFITVLTTYILVKYQPQPKKWHQSIIALAYIVAGILYSLVSNYAPLKMQIKYPWLHEISPWWGLCLIIIGLFWIMRRMNNLTTVVVGITTSTVLFWSCFNLGLTKSQARFGDWRSLGQEINRLQVNNIPVAFIGSYQVLEFFGRLAQPIQPLENQKQIKLWVQQHPEGWVVIRNYSISPMQLQLLPAAHYL